MPPTIFLVLYLLGAVCLLAAAFKVEIRTVQLGWLGMFFWMLVAILRAAGVS